MQRLGLPTLLWFFPCWLLFTVACTRSVPEHSLLRFRLPSRTSNQSKALYQSLSTWPGSSHKICFAANVKGPGIPETTSPCAPTRGVYTQFLPEGGAIEMMVPAGSDRTVEVFAYITPDQSQSCPTWTFDCVDGGNCKVYKVGEALNVNIQGETTIDISVSFPGWNAHVVASSTSPSVCQPSVRAVVYSSGEIKDANGGALLPDLSHPTNEGLFSSLSNLETLGTGRDTTDPNLLTISPFVYSLTKDPATGAYYGLMGSGQIVGVNASTGQTTEFTTASCPLNTCSIPVWMQSMSLDLRSKVYGLDQGGGLWSINSSTGLWEKEPNGLGPFANQVTFF